MIYEQGFFDVQFDRFAKIVYFLKLDLKFWTFRVIICL